MSSKKSAPSAPAPDAPSAPAPDAPKNRGGRPSTGKSINFNIRVDPEARAIWQEAAKISGQPESAWAREALDEWASITTLARKLASRPATLVAEAIEDRSRVRAALAELRRARSLSTTEQRVLRILDAAEWARRFGS